MNKALIMIVVAILGFLSFQSAYAGEESGFDLQIGGASVHQEGRKDGQPWNERNAGFGIQHHSPGTLFGAKVEYYTDVSTIKNSEFGQTIHIGGGFRKQLSGCPSGAISVGVIAGVMNYPSKYNKENRADNFFPIVLPTLTVCNRKRVCLDGMYIPKVEQNHGSAAILFTARFPLSQ